MWCDSKAHVTSLWWVAGQADKHTPPASVNLENLPLFRRGHRADVNELISFYTS